MGVGEMIEFGMRERYWRLRSSSKDMVIRRREGGGWKGDAKR